MQCQQSKTLESPNLKNLLTLFDYIFRLWWPPCPQGCKSVQGTTNAPARENRCESLCNLIQPILLTQHNYRYPQVQYRLCCAYVWLIGRPWPGSVIAAQLQSALHLYSCVGTGQRVVQGHGPPRLRPPWLQLKCNLSIPKP